MKNVIIVITALFLATSAAHAAQTFTLTSRTIKPNGKIEMEHVFNSFGCTGKNVSPELIWKNAPKDTKSFALTMYDPDAPTGSGWWHWVVFNVPGNVHMLPGGVAAADMPKGAVQSRTDFGKPGYGGPCPPPGKPHHYVFTVYALKEVLQLDADASPAMVGFYANQNKIASAKLTATFGR